MVIGARKREVGMSVLGRVPQSLLVASGGRAAAGKAEDESCGRATAEDDNAARRRSEQRAAERGITGHALANIAGARAIILDASHSCDLGQAAMGAHIAKVVRPDGGTVCQRRFGARRRGRPGIG
jgi:hypothetical protein